MDIEIKIPPHGYVRYVDHLGTDLRIVEAARISYKSPSKGEEQDKKLLEYLYKNKHTSPFEQCNLTLNIKFPIFLMHQFVHHRTFRLNKWSERYSELVNEFFLPKTWRAQDVKNKQGSSQTSEINQSYCFEVCNQANKVAYTAYQVLLKEGVSKEQARIVLPLSIYTEIYVNIDLHNLMHFLRLRLDAHAQSEMQDVALAIKQIAEQLYPWTFELFDKYEAIRKSNP